MNCIIFGNVNKNYLSLSYPIKSLSSINIEGLPEINIISSKSFPSLFATFSVGFVLAMCGRKSVYSYLNVYVQECAKLNLRTNFCD